MWDLLKFCSTDKYNPYMCRAVICVEMLFVQIGIWKLMNLFTGITCFSALLCPLVILVIALKWEMTRNCIAGKNDNLPQKIYEDYMIFAVWMFQFLVCFYFTRGI